MIFDVSFVNEYHSNKLEYVGTRLNCQFRHSQLKRNKQTIIKGYIFCSVMGQTKYFGFITKQLKLAKTGHFLIKKYPNSEQTWAQITYLFI